MKVNHKGRRKQLGTNGTTPSGGYSRGKSAKRSICKAPAHSKDSFNRKGQENMLRAALDGMCICACKKRLAELQPLV